MGLEMKQSLKKISKYQNRATLCIGQLSIEDRAYVSRRKSKGATS